MFQMKISRKEKISITLAALFVVLALLDRLVLAPLKGTLEGIDGQTRIAEKKLAYSLSNLSQKGRMAAEYKKYGLQPKGNIPDDKKTASMLNEIEDLAGKSGVLLIDVKPQPTKDVNFYKEFIIDVSAQGLMADMVKFLHQLHDSPLMLRTENLHLELKDKDSSTVNALIKITKISA